MLDSIDHIYVLTLQQNPEHASLEHYFRSLFGNRLTLYTVEGTPKRTNGGQINTSLTDILRHRHTDDTALDITKNHVSMIKEAHQKGFEHVLFLEEDARFSMDSFSLSKQRRVETWMNKNKEKWDILYLGYCPWPTLVSFFVTFDIVRIFTPLTAHAYILNRQGMQKILMHMEKPKHFHFHIDHIFGYRIQGLKKYGIFPMVAFQKTDPALYTKACDHLGVTFPFHRVCLWFQWISVFIPIVVLCVCAVWIGNRYCKK